MSFWDAPWVGVQASLRFTVNCHRTTNVESFCCSPCISFYYYFTMPRGQTCWRLGLVMSSLLPYHAQRPDLLEAGACDVLSVLCMSFHFLSIPLVPFNFLSFLFIPFISFHFVSLPFVSFHFLISFHFLSLPFIAFHFLSFPFIAFHFLSCPCLLRKYSMFLACLQFNDHSTTF